VIQGKRDEIAALLDGLAYGDASTPGTTATRDAWRRAMEEGRRKMADFVPRRLRGKTTQ
jgi:hypothetical protein